MAQTSDPIALELFKNAVFSIADEMALTVFRTTYSGVLKDNMDYPTGFADADGKLAAQGLTLPGHLGSGPTAMEAGLPGFEVTSWYGLWFPAGTPRAIVQKLQATVARAFEEKDMKDLWFSLGAEPGGAGSEEFRDFVGREVRKWAKVVRDANVTVD